MLSDDSPLLIVWGCSLFGAILFVLTFFISSTPQTWIEVTILGMVGLVALFFAALAAYLAVQIHELEDA